MQKKLHWGFSWVFAREFFASILFEPEAIENWFLQWSCHSKEFGPWQMPNWHGSRFLRVCVKMVLADHPKPFQIHWSLSWWTCSSKISRRNPVSGSKSQLIFDSNGKAWPMHQAWTGGSLGRCAKNENLLFSKKKFWNWVPRLLWWGGNTCENF